MGVPSSFSDVPDFISSGVCLDCADDASAEGGGSSKKEFAEACGDGNKRLQ